MADLADRGRILVEFRKLGPELAEALGVFFERSRNEPYFHPHPLTSSEAARICAYPGPDIYVAAVAQNVVLAYGMLRGWEEGYSIPSLGIMLSPESRGTGLAQLLVQYLHFSAKLRGAVKIRLKVYPENVRAVALYRRIGYEFDSAVDDGQIVGIFEIDNAH